MNLTSAWCTATTADELRRAEDEILAASIGSVTSTWSTRLAASDIVRGRPGEGGPLVIEAAWLARARIAEDGARSTELFGPLGADERLERIAHIPVHGAVAHPSIDATMRCVPVLPPGLRPPIHSAGVFGRPALDAHYEQVVRWVEILRDRTWEDLDDEVRRVVLAPVQAIREASSRGSMSRWIDPVASRPRPGVRPEREEVRVEPTAIGLAGAEVVLDHGMLTIVDLDGRARRLDVRGAHLEALTEDAFVVSVDGVLFAMDRRTGTWCAPPPEVPLVTMVERYERVILVRDDGAELLVHELVDYLRTSAFAADRRFVWLEDKVGTGGIFRVEDGANVGELPPELESDLPAGLAFFDEYDAEPTILDRALAPGDDPEEHSLGDERLRSPAAFAFGERAVLTFREGVVARDGVPFFALKFPVKLAAFDAHGTRLVTYSGARDGIEVTLPTLRVFDVSEDAPRLVHRRRMG